MPPRAQSSIIYVGEAHIRRFFCCFRHEDLLNLPLDLPLFVLAGVVVEMSQSRPNNLTEQALAADGVHLVKTHSLQYLERVVLFVWIRTSGGQLLDLLPVLSLSLLCFMIAKPHVDGIDSLGPKHGRFGDVGALAGHDVLVNVRPVSHLLVRLFDRDLPRKILSFLPGRILIRRQIIRMGNFMRFDYHSSLW